MDESKLNQILNMVRAVPTLPEVAQELSRLAGDPTASAQDMAHVAEADLGLAAQILRVVNSSFFGFSRQISTIPQAIVVLGTHGVRNIALGLTVSTLRPQLNTDSQLFDVDDFWRHSLSVAIGARQLARELVICDPEEAFLAGLLHDIGKLILIESCAEQYQELITAANTNNQPLHVLEETQLGFNHADVGFALCERWKIPDSVAYSVQNHHHWNCEMPLATKQNQLLFLVNSANNLTKVSGIGFSGNACVTPFCMQTSFSHGSLTEALQNTLESLPLEVAHTEHLFNITSQHNNTNISEPGSVCIGVIVQNRDLFTIFSLLLLSQGIIPVSEQDQIPTGTEMIAILTDSEMNPNSVPVGWSQHILTYCYSKELNHPQSPQDISFEIDVQQLRIWLNEQLPTSTMEKLV
ncbi:HDOD domain-containing protein [uncultured Gimesia sp.]|uniref:HDOD domain-containing protein n=1 Tax=uncultured Gimesia sp. TaxID=1678688 RepID=UPI0030DA0EB6|tara:strand:- start:52425 stop:53651 length:1227 start_codon:yes stop_codon:yes gene_type:complete